MIALIVFVGGSALAEDFKGFYVGGFAASAPSNTDAATTTTFSPTGYFASTSVPAIAAAGAQNMTPSAFSGGGLAGYNFQDDNFVFGLEVDFGSMGLSDSRSTTAIYPCCITTGFTVTQSVKTGWLFTARPRMGVVFNRFLAYGTAGAAVTNVNYQATFTDTFATAHENGGVNGTKPGWAAGGGAEVKLVHHWSAKGEYLHSEFAAATISGNLTAFSPPIGFPTNTFSHSVKISANMARFGVNYRF